MAPSVVVAALEKKLPTRFKLLTTPKEARATPIKMQMMTLSIVYLSFIVDKK
jgi:hypothetical protein